MKKIVLSLVLLTSISAGIWAGSLRNDPPRKRNAPLGGIKELNLTSDQQSKVDTLNKTYKTQLSDLRKKHESEVKEVLTPEQQQKWQQRSENRSARFDRRYHSNRRHGKFAGRGQSQFNAETKDKLYKLHQDFLKEKDAIVMSRIAPDAQKEKLRALKEKYVADRKEIVMGAKTDKNSSTSKL